MNEEDLFKLSNGFVAYAYETTIGNEQKTLIVFFERQEEKDFPNTVAILQKSHPVSNFRYANAQEFKSFFATEAQKLFGGG